MKHFISLQLGIGTGNPGVQMGLPIPLPGKNHTRLLRVQVSEGTGLEYKGLQGV